ncbi:het-r protein [Colletotrichum musicola]|uniref:Het-r protein n=1 Tax=Colletotrichum musicola TaxID=2175873 RepID=A0A8H6KGM8_9PEZI|nr:het-r protein [Colletotrichum musicola]
MRYFRTPIEIDPAQVYLSALVFGPTNSIIRGLFRDEEPKWPLKPVVDQDWSPCLQTLEGHEEVARAVNISPDKTTLASASEDGTVKLWDTATGHCVRTFPFQASVESVAFSNDATMLASASDSGIELWSMITGHCVRTLPIQSDCRSVAFSNDGAILASGSYRAVVQLWDTKSGQCLHTLQGHRGTVNSVAFSGDGSLVASGSYDKTARLWQTSTGTCLTTIDQDSPGEGTVAFSPDGTQIAFGHDLFGSHLWDVTTNQSKRILSGHNGPVASVAFSGDGSLLASASFDGSIKLWDLTGDDPLSPCQLPETQSDALSDSNNGNRLLSVSGNKTSIWDTKTGQCLRMIYAGSNNDCSATVFNDEVHIAETFGNHIEITDITMGRYRKWLRTLEVRGSEGPTIISHEDIASVPEPIYRTSSDSDCSDSYSSYSLQFDEESVRFSTSEYRLHTNSATIDLSTGVKSGKIPLEPSIHQSLSPSPESYDLEDERSWILKSGRRYLWLPTEYRSFVRKIHGSTLAIGYHSGRVLIIRFS